MNQLLEAAERGEAYKAREAVVRTGGASAVSMSPAIQQLFQATRNMGRSAIAVLDALDLKVSHEAERQSTLVRSMQEELGDLRKKVATMNESSELASISRETSSGPDPKEISKLEERLEASRKEAQDLNNRLRELEEKRKEDVLYPHVPIPNPNPNPKPESEDVIAAGIDATGRELTRMKEEMV